LDLLETVAAANLGHEEREVATVSGNAGFLLKHEVDAL
jgi:hypothetical protein